MQNGKKTEIQRKRQEIQLQKYSLEYKNTNANTNTNTNTKMLECHCTPEEKVFFLAIFSNLNANLNSHL